MTVFYKHSGVFPLQHMIVLYTYGLFVNNCYVWTKWWRNRVDFKKFQDHIIKIKQKLSPELAKGFERQQGNIFCLWDIEEDNNYDLFKIPRDKLGNTSINNLDTECILGYMLSIHQGFLPACSIFLFPSEGQICWFVGKVTCSIVQAV